MSMEASPGPHDSKPQLSGPGRPNREMHSNNPNMPSSTFNNRQPSQTQAMDSTTNQELAQLFECPVCYDYVLPPIMQCATGHLVCGTCRPKLQGCPTCRGQPQWIRNLAMEKVAATVYFPCKYTPNGCSNALLHQDKVEHEVYNDTARRGHCVPGN